MTKTIKIRVGRREAKNFLIGGHSHRNSIPKKLREAVVEAYPDINNELEQKEEAWAIRDKVLASPEVKAIQEEYAQKLRVLFDGERQVRKEEDEKIATLINKAFDEAGITTRRADGYGGLVVINERSANEAKAS